MPSKTALDIDPSEWDQYQPFAPDRDLFEVKNEDIGVDSGYFWNIHPE